MAREEFRTAYYIKLGAAGAWEADSLATGKLRFGWDGQSCEDINAGRWELIRGQLQHEHRGKPSVATADFNRLVDLTESTSADVWITFAQGKMWWTRMADGPVRQDEVSKFRETNGWRDTAANRTLHVSELPGKLSRLQGYRATACRVGESDVLERVLNGEESPICLKLRSHREKLVDTVAEALGELHWKDFETVVDLVFRASGWRRVGVLGQTQKGFDLELIEPITGDRYLVQVKSKANLRDLADTREMVGLDGFRRLYFVVHSPTADLRRAADGLDGDVEIVLAPKLAELVVRAGLVDWLMQKVR